MYLRIKVDCPLCGDQPTWIYDTDAGQKHREMQGCPGGCTALQQIEVRELSESEVKEVLREEKHPENALDL